MAHGIGVKNYWDRTNMKSSLMWYKCEEVVCILHEDFGNEKV